MRLTRDLKRAVTSVAQGADTQTATDVRQLSCTKLWQITSTLNNTKLIFIKGDKNNGRIIQQLHNNTCSSGVLLALGIIFEKQLISFEDKFDAWWADYKANKKSTKETKHRVYK